MSIRVFVSYRRSDSRHVAGRLRDHLAAAFGDDNVFFDVHSIGFGRDFRKEIRERLGGVDAVVAVIGPGFDLERLGDPDDYVRFELVEAISQGKLLVPVLVEDARIPAPAELPAELEALSYLNAAPLRPDPDFRRDATRLIETIEHELGRERSGDPPAPPAKGPGKYQVSTSGNAQGTVIGDHNTVNMNFGPPPGTDET